MESTYSSYNAWPSCDWMDEPMTDEKLIGYCETHCTTPRALFSADDINKMRQLAGLGIIDNITGFHAMHEDMENLCKLAREKLRKSG